MIANTGVEICIECTCDWSKACEKRAVCGVAGEGTAEATAI